MIWIAASIVIAGLFIGAGITSAARWIATAVAIIITGSKQEYKGNDNIKLH